ncbi:MAG: helix-turn-helix domain-containing protein [Oligoflexia bacterium]|nr:helix-turn-helix domain-containing protein [Oligoflexia bacterium]
MRKKLKKLRKIQWGSESMDVSTKTIRHWIAEGKLSSTKINGARRIYEDEIMNLIERGHKEKNKNTNEESVDIKKN